MNFFKIIFVFFLFAQFVVAKEYSIVLFSAKVLHYKDKKLFLKRFPEGKIKKYGKYYEFKIGPFKSFTLAKEHLKKAKKFYHDAFIINQTKEEGILSSENETAKKNSIKITKQKRYVEPNENKNFKKFDDSISLDESKLEDIYTKKQIEYALSSHIKPKINDPKVLSYYEIPKKYKTDDSEKYDILMFRNYINTLLHSNEQMEEAFYQRQIDYILSEVKKDRYGFDIYIDGYLRTGSSISAQTGNVPNVNGDYTNAGISLNANKLLYDGKYNLINTTYDILLKRLADIDKLNAEDELLMLGFAIYSNLYTAQEELKMFRKIYDTQKDIVNIVKEKYKLGKSALLDLIDSKNDLFDLQKTILTLEYAYLDNDYILRHSIRSKSKKPYKLFEQKIELNLESLALLQKEAIVHSGVIAKESNLLKIKQADLLYEKKRRYPEYRFHSFMGYGLSSEKAFSLNDSGYGSFWEIGINFKLPIYNRNDINLNEQKRMLEVLKQKSTLSSKQRSVLIQVEKSYNEINRTKKEIDILKEQTSLLRQKLKITKTQYLNGILPYKSYSDAIKEFLTNNVQLIKVLQKYKQEVLTLSIIVGKRDIY